MTPTGDRIKTYFKNALDVLDGSVKRSIDANSTADEARDALIREMAERTTALDTALAVLQSQVNNGQTIDPAEFAKIRDEVISISNAFPDLPDAEPTPTPAPEPTPEPTQQFPEVDTQVDNGFTARRTNRS